MSGKRTIEDLGESKDLTHYFKTNKVSKKDFADSVPLTLAIAGPKTRLLREIREYKRPVRVIREPLPYLIELKHYKRNLRKMAEAQAEAEMKVDRLPFRYNLRRNYHSYKMPKRSYKSYKRGRYGLDRDTVERRRLAVSNPKLWKQYWNTENEDDVRTQAFVPGQPANLFAFGASAATASPSQMANRAMFKYKGRGDYRKWIPRVAGAAWHGLQGGFGGFGRGGVFGGIQGALEGGKAGWDAGANLSKMIGWGDYGPMSTNKIIDGGSGPQQNISVNDDSMTGDIYFSHTEYIGNLTVTTPSSPASGTTTFQLLSYDLNPGLKNFPFLAQIASNFELYQWQGLIFQYKPLSGEFGASSVSNTLGKIVMATKYGVNQNSAFTSMIEMQNYDYANSTKPSCAIVHGVETDPKQGLAENLMVRTGAPDPSAPRVLYDLGKFYIATEGIPYNGASQTIVLGELWCTYRVKLSRAKLWDTLGEAIAFDRFTGTSGASQLITGFTSNSLSTIGGTMQILITSASGYYIFPTSVNQGKYLIVMKHVSTTPTQHAFNPITVPAAYSATTVVNASFSAPLDNTAATLNTVTLCYAIVTVNAPNQTQAAVQFTRSQNAAGTFDVYVTQVDPQFS